MDIELAQALAENELLKSMLYCTKRSCNNCGKVNCENFQRQRKDYCENWVSYKDYIAELEAQIEKMKHCENDILKALKENNDYEWLPAHNGQAKYIYLHTVKDIIIEKFEKEIKENE